MAFEAEPQSSLIEYLNKIYSGKNVDFSRQLSLGEALIPENHPNIDEIFVGERLPFRNQKLARKKYLEQIRKQYFIWCDSGRPREPLKSVIYPVCCGASGIGKTTFIRKALRSELIEPSIDLSTEKELGALLHTCCNSPNFGELVFRISFSDDAVVEEELRYTPDKSLALRLLHQVFSYQDGVRVTYADFVKQLDVSWINRITFSEVINVIRIYAGIPENMKCMIVLHLDETQVLLENATHREYLNNCLRHLAGIILSLKHTFLLCPLTGTHATDLFKLISDSGANFEQIPLSLLSDEDMTWIVVELLKRHNYTLSSQLQPVVRNMLHCCGGNPRFLSILVTKGMCTQSEKLSMKRLFGLLKEGNIDVCEKTLNQTVSYIQNKYTRYYEYILSPEFARVVPRLVAFTILERPVTRRTKVGTYVIEEMEKTGLVFLELVNQGSLAQYKITYPFISLYMLYSAATAHAAVLTQPLKLLQQVSFRMAPPENERMDLSFLVYKLEFLKLLKSTESFMLSDWIPLRAGQKDIELQFPRSFEISTTKKMVTAKTWRRLLKEQQHESIIAWHNKGTAKFADAFIFLKKSDGDPYIIFIQSKQSVISRRNHTSGYLPLTTPEYQSVEKEHDKVQEAIGPISIPHLFVYITDNRADNRELKHDEVLIVITQHKSFFGDIIAFRRLACL